MESRNRGHRPNGRHAETEVVKVEDLNKLIRKIYLRSKDLVGAQGFGAGQHFKLFFSPDGGSAADYFKYGNTTKPLARTYTIRNIDPEQGILTVEFVMHGVNGPASSWAMKARPGDKIMIGLRPGRAYSSAGWYLLAGDETALPAISVILEDLPTDAKGVVYIETDNAQSVLPLQKPDGIQLHWVFRDATHPWESNVLFDSITSIVLPDNNKGSRYIWMAGESRFVHRIRTYAGESWKIGRDEFYATVYWEYGESEDRISRER